MYQWIAGIIAAIFSLEGFLTGVGMTVLGVTIYNVIVSLIQDMLNAALAQIGTVSSAGVTSPSITGFAGWVCAQLFIPQCLSVIVTMVALKFTLRKIPFINW